MSGVLDLSSQGPQSASWSGGPHKFKAAVVLLRLSLLKIQNESLVLSNELINVELPPWKI